MPREDYRGAAAALTLNADLTAGDATFSIAGDTSGWPTGASGRPFTVVIDRGKASEEKILCATLTPTTVSVSTRGYDGTSDENHSAGALVEHVGPSATKMDDVDSHLYDTTRDDHTQYVPTDGSRSFFNVDNLTDVPFSVGGSTNGEGSAATLARSDHQHAIADGGISDPAMFAGQVVSAAALQDSSIAPEKLTFGSVGAGRSALYFPNSTARDAALSAPTVGQQVILTDTGSLLVYVGATDGWSPPWNLPWGELGYAVNTTGVLSISTVTDLSGLTITKTVVANRLVETTVFLPEVVQATSLGNVSLTIADGSNVQKQQSRQQMPSGGLGMMTCRFVESTSAGSLVRKARLATGAGTTGFAASGNEIAWILMKDIGPNGSPA